MSAGLSDGLALIDSIGGLDEYYLFHAARADILSRMSRPGEAADAYRRALALATNAIEQDFLQRRLAAVTASSASPGT
jgi:RNA polymerase sigma-70 factor (ECF subfamily)